MGIVLHLGVETRKVKSVEDIVFFDFAEVLVAL